MAEIVPALIPKDFYELEDRVAEVAGHAKNIHIDMCDGIFVRNTSWPKIDDKIFIQILDGERGLPEWEDIDYEVHLMTAHPEQQIFDWIMGGAYRVVVQLESFFPGFKNGFDEVGRERFEQMLEKLKTDHGNNPDNDDDFYQVGISVMLDTPIEVIKPLIEKFHFIQVMSIPEIGFQGATFDERAYDRIKELKEFIKTLPIHKDITVDGGVNQANAVKLREVGADRLVIGSAIFNSEVPSDAIEHINALLD